MRIIPFGITKDRIPADLIELENHNGMTVKLLSFGASVHSIEIPQKDGGKTDVALGYGVLSRYERNPECMGATVGRVANRIEDARFSLNGVSYPLCPWKTPGKPMLHSFPNGYSERVFDYALSRKEDGESVLFSLRSPHMDQGYPGNLTFEVRYTLTDENALMIGYEAVSDRDTLFAPTNHTYFNLNGHDSGNVLSHRLTIASDRIPVYSDSLCPTGSTRPVEGTPYDFRFEKEVGRDLFSDDPGLVRCKGYDLAYITNGGNVSEKPAFAARLAGDKTGITMELFTDMPSIQLYTANSLNVSEGKNGASYGHYAGICLEPGYVPNAVRAIGLEKPIIRAGERKSFTEAYRFTYGV